MIRSLRMQPNRKLYFKELPMPPTPGPGEVQVRMAFASICGYDMMMLRGTAAYPLNGYLGHEGSGVVTAVGENVRALHPGDRVTINPYEPCGLCDACRSNRPEYCTNPSSGYANLMTEYLNIRQQQVFRLPEQVSLRAGSLIEPLMMAMHAVSKARLSYGKRVILLGCGAMGQIILKLVRQHPVGQIVVVEPVAEKREAALRFGADIVIDPNTQSVTTEALTLTGGIGYDAVIEASGDRKSAAITMNLVARRFRRLFRALRDGLQSGTESVYALLEGRDALRCLRAERAVSGSHRHGAAFEAGGGRFLRAAVFQRNRGVP